MDQNVKELIEMPGTHKTYVLYFREQCLKQISFFDGAKWKKKLH